MKRKTRPLRKQQAQARREASIKEHGGTGLWRPRAATFQDRKKAANKRACRGPIHVH